MYEANELLYLIVKLKPKAGAADDEKDTNFLTVVEKGFSLRLIETQHLVATVSVLLAVLGPGTTSSGIVFCLTFYSFLEYLYQFSYHCCLFSFVVYQLVFQ